MDRVQIFISYASEDQTRVKQLYHRLVEAGFHPWLDREHILPGMRWEPIIKQALKRSDFALVCLSVTSINKRGFLQKEIKEALEHAKEKLEDDVWLIPARLDDCDVPESMSAIQWVDLFEADGWERLLQALEYQLKKQGKPLPAAQPKSPSPPPDPRERQGRKEAERPLAEQQLREQEIAEHRSREQEFIDQQRQEQSLAEDRRREQGLAEHRLEQELAEKQRRKQEVAEHRPIDGEERKRVEKIPEQFRKAKVTQLNPTAFLPSLLRSRKLFILAALVIAVISTMVYLWSYADRPSDKVENAGAPTPVTTPVPTPDLKSFGFETVTLDAFGKIIKRESKEARYFVEDLDGVKLETVEIPAGDLQMGSSVSEVQVALADLNQYGAGSDRHNNELPKHTVRIPEFYIGRFEVTREQWRQVARWMKLKVNLKEDPSEFKDSWRQPVEQVSWAEAVEFCERLSKKTGREYRLPTEAEWEYAARAGTTTPFAFGETITPEIVNYNGVYPYGNAPKGVYRNKTTPVGSLGVANPFGLFDMHGNVLEWCQDAWHASYKGAPNDGSAWLSGGDSSAGVSRGGSWKGFGESCRAAHRFNCRVGDRLSYLGFRVVVSARN